MVILFCYNNVIESEAVALIDSGQRHQNFTLEIPPIITKQIEQPQQVNIHHPNVIVTVHTKILKHQYICGKLLSQFIFIFHFISCRQQASAGKVTTEERKAKSEERSVGVEVGQRSTRNLRIQKVLQERNDPESSKSKNPQKHSSSSSSSSSQHPQLQYQQSPQTVEISKSQQQKPSQQQYQQQQQKIGEQQQFEQKTEKQEEQQEKSLKQEEKSDHEGEEEKSGHEEEESRSGEEEGRKGEPSGKRCFNKLCLSKKIYKKLRSKVQHAKYRFLCRPCYQSYVNNDFCEFCQQIYSSTGNSQDDDQWIGCDECNRWNHIECEQKYRNKNIHELKDKDDTPYLCLTCAYKAKEKASLESKQKIKKEPISVGGDEVRAVKPKVDFSKDQRIPIFNRKIESLPSLEYFLQNYNFRLWINQNLIKDDLQTLRELGKKCPEEGKRSTKKVKID